MMPMNLHYREARVADLPTLIQMLAEDQLGQAREDSSEPINPAYIKMFERISRDPNNQLIVAIQQEGDIESIVGMLQLTYIPYLTYMGSWRSLIEGVRVHKSHRGQGIGRAMFMWAIEQAKQKGCAMVQLTSNKQRSEAIRFYEGLGFVASHEGFKLHLE